MLYIRFIIIVVAIYLTLYVSYNSILLLVHFFIKERDDPSSPPRTKFGIIIPAHDEEILLPRLLISINQQHYPLSLFDAIVIADNCIDRTIEIASEHNAIILEREDSQRLGKGYAIKFALENISIDQYDAILIVDADTIVAKDALRQLDQTITKGGKIIQCYNGVANPDDSWFTRLMDISRTIANEIYQPSKEKLGLSSHLMGNGMCFSRDIVLTYGWDSFTVGEDWEYYAKLVEKGERIAFARKARVYHQESSSLKQATPQRMRWSGGRFEILLKYGFNLLLTGLIQRDIKRIDASLPLLFPNPSLGFNLAILLFLVSYLLRQPYLTLWSATIMSVQILIFCIGVCYTRNKTQKFLSIFVAPIFLIWKTVIDTVSIFGIGNKKWIRTKRDL